MNGVKCRNSDKEPQDQLETEFGLEDTESFKKGGHGLIAIHAGEVKSKLLILST